MERFIALEDIKGFCHRLEGASGLRERETLKRLLAAEEAKLEASVRPNRPRP